MVSAQRPQHRIIHIADYHWVAQDDLAADLRDQDPAISDEDVREEHERIVAAVRRVQASQRKLIRWLGKQHGVRRVHLEGLSDADIQAYRYLVERLGRNGADGLPPHLGAVAQSLVAGEMNDVAAAEDEAAYLAANPVAGDAVEFDGPANTARQAAVVKRLTASGPLSVVVLGGDHDLSEHVRALGNCEYLRVFVEGY